MKNLKAKISKFLLLFFVALLSQNDEIQMYTLGIEVVLSGEASGGRVPA